MTINLPRLRLLWRIGGDLSLGEGDAFTEGQFTSDSFQPRPICLRRGARMVIVVGSVIVGEKIDPLKAAGLVLASADLAATVRGFNGQFLIVDQDGDKRSLTLISDRHNGIPFYLATIGDQIAGAFLYSDLAEHLRRAGAFDLVPEHLFEFLWLQRLLMDKTHDTRSRFLPAATILTVDAAGSRQRRYWRPNFTKNEKRGVREAGEAIASGLRRSMARRTSDAKRYGLFLSGGHDSRTVLAASPSAPLCVTVGYSDNYEVSCARKLAEVAGAPFRFIKLPPDHLDRVADAAARLCSGLYSIDHALFLGLDDAVSSEADVVFHGHGIDYMYQGMYLPAQYLSIAGRPTFFRRLTPLSGDLASAYNNEIPFRLKHVDLMSFVRAEWRDRLAEHMRASAQAVLEDSRDVAATDADRWEYFLIHALGRHFAWPNIGSMMVGTEQRTPSFDNDLFDVYLSLPPQARVTASALRSAQWQLNPDLASVPTGNWGMPASYSPLAKTAWLVARKALRHLTGNSRFRAPHAEDRTWPDRDKHLCEEAGWQGRVAAAIADPELESALPFLDWPMLRTKAQEWMSRPSGGASLLVELLSLQMFLKSTK